MHVSCLVGIYYQKLTLKSSDALLPRVYGVPEESISKPKIHKKIVHLELLYPQLIICYTNLRYIFTKYYTGTFPILHFLLYFLLLKSFYLYNMITGLSLDDNYILSSLDVVLLFTNVSIRELALEAVFNRWRYIRMGPRIIKDEFLSAIKFVLSSTYFVFDERIYRQSFGTFMDLPLSSIIADITLQDLELRALNSLKFHIPFYFRYVDDIILSIPKDKTNEVLDIFNSLHRLTFTQELQADNRISFLDLSIILINNNIVCD